MSRISRGIAAVSAVAVLALGMSPATAGTSSYLPMELCAPSANNFDHPGSPNPYFPLTNASYVLVGPDGGETHGLKITVGGTAPFYDGTITTTVVLEHEWLDLDGNGRQQGSDEVTIEDSYNYFAQVDADGIAPRTVCYFGESVDNYENGVLKDHSGSWRADAPVGDPCREGDQPNAPGIVMPAMPKTGMKYQQESAKCAQDVAQIVGDISVTLRNGRSFPDVIRTKEGSLLETGKNEFKSYARNFGLIIDDGLQLCTPGSNCKNANA